MNELKISPTIRKMQAIIEEPSFDEIKEANSAYILYVKSVGDIKARDTYLKSISSWIGNVSKIGGRAQVDLVSLGDFEFWPYTSKFKLWTKLQPLGNQTLQKLETQIAVDPINLVFWNNAKASDVDLKFKQKIFPKWLDTQFAAGGMCADTHYVYMDESKLHPPLGHVIKDWDDSQKFVENLFNCLPFVNKMDIISLQNKGKFQGIDNDGDATFIKIT